MVAGERPTVADFQEVLGDHGIELRRNGAEWAGPCPLCGGKDRFHVADSGGYALIGCRGCIDGEPEDNRKQRYGEIMALLFPRASPSPKAAMGRKAHKPSSNRTSRTAKTNPTTTAQAAELWAATVKCEDTPAQTYRRDVVAQVQATSCWSRGRLSLAVQLQHTRAGACGVCSGVGRGPRPFGLLLAVVRGSQSEAGQAGRVCALQSGGDGLGAVGWWWLSPGYSERVLLRSRIIGARLFAPRNLILASEARARQRIPATDA